jgi:hypothetical protein
MTNMKRVLMAAAAVVGLSLTGCGVDAGEPFRKGFPKADTVKLNLPSNSAALTGDGQRRDGLEGQTAEFYRVTRGVTVLVNGAGGAVLNLVEEIAKYPPTTVNQNVAVWGPHTEALSPNTYRFTVTRVADNQFEYLFEGKSKAEADSAFRTVLAGSHVATGDQLGSGTFLLDWDQVKTLPEHGKEVGKAHYVYSKQTATADVSIDARFEKVMDDETQMLTDANYKYRETPTMGGSFEFRQNKNFITPGAAIEVLTVKSRWVQAGAGRSDVRISGGDVVGGSATVSECWDNGFASRYLAASFLTAQTGNYGQASACGTFTTAEYAP